MWTSLLTYKLRISFFFYIKIIFCALKRSCDDEAHGTHKGDGRAQEKNWGGRSKNAPYGGWDPTRGCTITQNELKIVELNRYSGFCTRVATSFSSHYALCYDIPAIIRRNQGVEQNPNQNFINRFYAIFVELQSNLNRIFQNRKERTGTEPNDLITCEPKPNPNRLKKRFAPWGHTRHFEGGLYWKKFSTCTALPAVHWPVNVHYVFLSKYRPPGSEHSNNIINLNLMALLQAFYALYWPVNAKKNRFARVIF